MDSKAKLIPMQIEELLKRAATIVYRCAAENYAAS
jgi:hypothetical protein